MTQLRRSTSALGGQSGHAIEVCIPDWSTVAPNQIAASPVVSAQLEAALAVPEDALSAPCCLAAGGGTFYSAAQTRTGWTVGAGVEYAFSGPWSAKIEYDYMDFGTKSATFTGGIFPGAPFPFGIKQQLSVVELGLNYRFH